MLASEDKETVRCSTSQQEMQKRGFVPLIAFSDIHLLFQSANLGVKVDTISLAFAEDSINDFMAFLRLVKVSITDDLVRLEDKFDQTVVDLEESKNVDGSDMEMSRPLMAYDGKGFDNINKMGANRQLSLIQEHSMAQEESVLLRETSYRSQDARSASDFENSVLFGDDHPFKHIKDDDLFTVKAYTPQLSSARQHLIQTSAQPAPSINLLELIDSQYFGQPAQSQQKLEQQRFRKIHILSE